MIDTELYAHEGVLAPDPALALARSYLSKSKIKSKSKKEHEGAFKVSFHLRQTITTPVRTWNMKRNQLIKHLKTNGAFLLREGRKHSIFQKDSNKTQVPRHREIVDELARKICKDLRIPFVGEK